MGAETRGMIARNPCAERGKPTPVDKIWTNEHVARFLDVAPPILRLPMFLARDTGPAAGRRPAIAVVGL